MANSEEIKRFLESFTTEELIQRNNQHLDEVTKDHDEFVDLISKKICPMCKKGLRYVNHNKPCFHWLLRPKGIDKKHLVDFLEKTDLGYFRIQSFLRWIANTGEPVKNINNLLSEKDAKKVLEETIRYKNIEWTLSCSESDFLGHKDRRHKEPHYHIQIRINNRIFLSYSDAHIPFNHQDLWEFEAEKTGKYEHIELFGSGIQDIIDQVPAEEILNTVTTTNNPQKSTFHIQSLFEAKEGEKITGEQIAEAIEENKKTGVPIAKIMEKFGHKRKVIISPGEGIPEIPHRTKSKR